MNTSDKKKDGKKGNDVRTTISGHHSTIKLLEKYKIYPRETLESVIKRAITTHDTVISSRKE